MAAFLLISILISIAIPISILCMYLNDTLKQAPKGDWESNVCQQENGHRGVGWSRMGVLGEDVILAGGKQEEMEGESLLCCLVTENDVLTHMEKI